MRRLFMARAGDAVRSIASEESVAALAAHIRVSKGYSESFGQMSNRTKEDLFSGV